MQFIPWISDNFIPIVKKKIHLFRRVSNRFILKKSRILYSKWTALNRSSILYVAHSCWRSVNTVLTTLSVEIKQRDENPITEFPVTEQFSCSLADRKEKENSLICIHVLTNTCKLVRVAVLCTPSHTTEKLSS